MFGPPGRFSCLAEIEPATRPDLSGVRRQVAVLAPVADAFLVPDNHLGRATVSSIAVAHEVAFMGGRVVACINGRDRNQLGFERDLLTAVAYGVDHVLLVGGDRQSTDAGMGLRASTMLRLARGVVDDPRFAGFGGFNIGVAAQVGRPLPGWKQEADFVLAQVSYGAIDELVEWRHDMAYTGPVFPAVLVLASAAMAQRLCQGNFGIDIPRPVCDRLEENPMDGVEMALDRLAEIRECGAFAGAHLIPGTRYRSVAQALLRSASGD